MAYAVLLLLGALTMPAHAFSLDDVVARARAQAARPYKTPKSNLPPVFSQMQFADYQQIAARRERFEWADQPTPFRLSFYHQGMHFNTPVKINEVVGSTVREIKYDPARFDFGKLQFDAEQTRNLGYAGFRVLYPINRPDKSDEIMSLLGASYFRVIGQNQVYGLSARGLAIDSGLSQPEEFPRFSEFWIRRPAAYDKQLTIFALLESPRATGAYEFTLTPGKDAVLDVKSRVFLRSSVTVLGVAPLTSMFLFGPNQSSERRGYRPAIHDSNGLAIHTGTGEWLWRPLNDPKFVALSAFAVENPKGFGLLQRGHEFDRFEDLKDRYDLRPSAWIEPQGDWGKGHVQLIEIPTPDETNDNIVAFWVPDEQPGRSQGMVFNYRMHWMMDEPALLGQDMAWVRQTFHTDGERYQRNLIRQRDGTTAFLIDFEGPVLRNLPADAQLGAQYSANDNAKILEGLLEPNPAIGGYRLTLRVQITDPTKAAELRASLVSGSKAISETWSYQVPPSEASARP